MRVLVPVLLVTLSACNGECIDGVCPDFDNTIAYPGPCRAAVDAGEDSEQDCTFVYGSGGIKVAECSWYQPSSGDGGGNTANWIYSRADATLKGLSTTRFADATLAWVFDSSRVTVTSNRFGVGDRIYDASEFEFLPMPGRGMATPRADLGMLQNGTTMYTWTVDGDRRIRSAPTESLTYQLDGDGRITSIIEDRGHDGIPDTLETFEFDGANLVRYGVGLNDSTRATWSYDLGGNVVEHVSYDAGEGVPLARDVYDYSCW